MKVLIVTQAIDTDHPVLGFFHRWVEEFARRASHVEVIALTVGTHELPQNVSVYSLGKEKGAQSAFVYAWRFLRRAWVRRKEYDVVFVHMNQEYVLLAGLMWKLLGKRVYLWRNHYSGSILTDIAAVMCDHVFYTSAHSYTARYANACKMPIGIEVASTPSVPRISSSILFLARVSSSKRPDVLVRALGRLSRSGGDFTASFVGPGDEAYIQSLRDLAQIQGVKEKITFHGPIPHTNTAGVYATHEIYVNLAASGMFDKTIGEASQAGCVVLAASEDWRHLMSDDRVWCPAEEEAVAQGLAQLLALSERERTVLIEKQQDVLASHTLPHLMDTLVRTVDPAC